MGGDQLSGICICNYVICYIFFTTSCPYQSAASLLPSTTIPLTFLLIVLLLGLVSLLLVPILLLAHGILGLGNTLGEDPSLACSCTIWEGLMLSLHTGTRRLMCIVTCAMGIMVGSWLHVLAIHAIVIYIISTCVAIF